VGWAELPEALRVAIEQHTGEFIGGRQLGTGHNCLIGMRLHAANGVYFLKGFRSDKVPAVRTQQFERAVAPLVSGISPALAFSMDIAGWNVLGFHFLDGYRHADLAPGSRDLDHIANTLRALALIKVPDTLDVRRASQRYANYAGGDGSPFGGMVLCHTDLHKHNILVAEGEPMAKLVDWAWPTTGADWIDAACVILQLISEGHTPKQAEAWGEQIAPFRRAPDDHVSLFVKAIRNLWEEIAEADPQEWKTSVAVAANEWASHRNIA
jgi:hypothetical protein